MREELKDMEVQGVAGGKYKLNGNNGKLLFTTNPYIYQLKGVDPLEAQRFMNGFIGKYETDEEFDNACIEALQAKGWIDVIGTRTGY